MIPQMSSWYTANLLTCVNIAWGSLYLVYIDLLFVPRVGICLKPGTHHFPFPPGTYCFGMSKSDMHSLLVQSSTHDL